MKRTFYFGLTAAFLLLVSCSSNTDQNFQLSNPASSEMTDAQFVLTRADLAPTSEATVPVVKDASGKLIPSQIDDMDSDGKWDELAFVYTLAPSQKVKVLVSWVDKAKYPVFPARSNVRFGYKAADKPIVSLDKYTLPIDIPWKPYPFQMDGIGWENDRVAYRHYFDGRNCRDVFGKRTTQIVLDSIGITKQGGVADTYHVLSDWGRDILSVGKSFGAGGKALLVGDSLHRLGVLQYVPKNVIDSTKFTLINRGPVRGVFRIDYMGFQVNDKKVNVTETVRVWAGRYGYENTVTVSGAPEGAQLVTGLVHNFNQLPYISETYDNKIVARMTHDQQTYDRVWWLGLAILMPKDDYQGEFDTPDKGVDIPFTWCFKLKSPSAKYWVYSAWELDKPEFRNRQFFVDMVARDARMYANPATITKVK